VKCAAEHICFQMRYIQFLIPHWPWLLFTADNNLTTGITLYTDGKHFCRISLNIHDIQTCYKYKLQTLNLLIILCHYPCVRNPASFISASQNKVGTVSYTPMLNSPSNYKCRPPIPYFLHIHRVFSRMIHADRPQH
jgi:hypothetical protein